MRHRAGDRLPWGTLAVNLLGCLLLGVVLAAVEGHPRRAPLVAFVAVGVLGDLTTFSTFAHETLARARAGRWRAAAAYVALSVGAGVGLVLAGLALGARLR